MVDNQLAEIGVLFATLDEEPIAKALARDVRVRLSYVYKRYILSVNDGGPGAGEMNAPMCWYSLSSTSQVAAGWLRWSLRELLSKPELSARIVEAVQAVTYESS